jgi:hypothetical protein
MDEVSVRFRLVNEEAVALRKLADRERRRPTDQVIFLTLKCLRICGLLTNPADEKEQCQGGSSDGFDSLG